MEESGAMVAKKVWSMVRALYFMLRKDKSNKKIMLNFKMMMKRGKVARKAFHNFMLHYQAKDTIVNNHQYQLSSNVLPGEYIFSCSDTPLFRLKPRNGSSSHRFFSCAHATPTMEEADEMSVNIAVIKALEMLQSDQVVSSVHQRSPVVRITDSEDSSVDEAAEEFIQKFYKDLKKQT
ncbi:Avr9/Cf-9 rapidly elicited protein 146 [Heracleum sosnowskyi]|uniref:Avr9/Cf-9 rapidly elicited protein 146 n=1 Tax=Heracleum sosnowskyi TaxID=360622 RepID=A0AAD8MKB5_9APIA|nr:Avr9/Cf-9 rapidly elicited protein 146 [Heracleum sosnowskyi]